MDLVACEVLRVELHTIWVCQGEILLTRDLNDSNFLLLQDKFVENRADKEPSPNMGVLFDHREGPRDKFLTLAEVVKTSRGVPTDRSLFSRFFHEAVLVEAYVRPPGMNRIEHDGARA